MALYGESYEWKKGNSGSIKLEFTNDDGTPFDITGYTLFFSVKRQPGDPDAAAVITKEVGTVENPHTDPTNGITHIALSYEQTDKREGRYAYDIKMVNLEDNFVKTVLVGVFEIKDTVTDRVE